MAKRITALNHILGIALFAYGASYSAQDTVQATASPPGAVSPDTTKKPAAAKTSAQPASATVQPGKTSQALQKKKTSQEDIIDEEDLILPEKGVDIPVKKAAEEGTVAAPEKTTTGAPVEANRPSVDSTGLKTPSSVTPAAEGAAPATAVSAPAVKPAKPVIIEDAHPMNFARNLKEYRSPKLAMLLSLVVPGLGQAYIGRPGNYVKAGAFLAVEAAIIGVSAYYNNKGNKQYNQAKNYANTYYSYDSMMAYYSKLLDFLKTDQATLYPDSIAQGTLNGIYIDTLGTSTSSFTKSYNNNHPAQDYYHTIQNAEYVHGWKGCEPSLDELNGLHTGDTIKNPNYQYFYQRGADSSGGYLVNLIDKKTGQIVPGTDNQLQYGYSPYQRRYNTMMSESNKFYKTSTYVLFVILLNHVASAVDALISARSYNNWLLGRQTFWDKISLHPSVALSGEYLSPGLSMMVQF